jgi:type II secretory pathway component GspD/PulD (secretin)
VVNAEGRNARVPEKPVSLPGLSKRNTLDLKQMDILAVLKFLAEQSDLSIVPGKNVGGRVTLSLKAVTIQDALDIIALNHELAYVVQNGVIHVMTEADYQRLFGSSFADQRQVKTLYLQYADVTNVATVLGSIKSAVGRVVADGQTRTVVLIDVPEKLQQMVAAAESMDWAAQLQTQIFELKYAKAVDIKAEVEKALTPKLGAVRVDKRTNTLVVTDLLPHLQQIQRVINAFDRKTREVIIEAKIIEVRLNDRFQMGVDWEALLKNAKDLNLKATFPITPPLSSFGKLTVGTLATDKFKAVIELLETVGRTNILSTPQIAVVENEEAKILVGTREAFITSTVTQTTGAATTAEQITFIDVGLQLRVTPIINAEGFVTMKIKPEVSSVSRFLETGSKNQIPIVETSTAETTVMVKDGITIVIAGLMKDETVNATKKVPILGDIPIVGAAFRSTEERVVKTELIFFLTPSLISGKESVAGVASP